MSAIIDWTTRAPLPVPVQLHQKRDSMRKEFIPKLTVAEITWLFEHGFTIRTDFIRREGYYHWLYYMGKFDSLGVYRSERACYNLARRIEAKRITLVPDAPESQALP